MAHRCTCPSSHSSGGCSLPAPPSPTVTLVETRDPVLARRQLRELVFHDLLLTLPRLANSNVMLFTEQWMRVGYGFREIEVLAGVTGFELRVRGWIGEVDARATLALPVYPWVDLVFQGLTKLARRYCRLLVLHAPHLASDQHRRFLRGDLTLLEGRAAEDRVDNDRMRAEHLASLDLSPSSGSPLRVFPSRALQARPAESSVRSRLPCMHVPS